VSWDDALDQIVARWEKIGAESGPEAILGYSYLGSMGVLDAFGTTQALFNRLGATQLERSICGPQWFALSGVTQWPWSDPENLPDARLIVVWGMDPVSTSIHTWELIRRARKNGARLVVIDPYRSRTARYADVHLRPHVGTDGALALAMANVIVAEGLADDAYLDERTTGVDAYKEAVAEWTPDRAAGETGVPAEEIVALAREYASVRPAAIRLGVGMQRSTGAGAALRAIQCLSVVTGQWRWPAGGIAAAVSLSQLDLPALSRPDLLPSGTRQVNMIQLGRVLTDSELDPPIRSLFVWNSNPAVIAADQRRVIEGLRREDLFTVVHDQFLTDTAMHADLVLPATTMLEHADLVGSWGFSYLSWNEAAIEPVGESKSNAEVARLLAARLGLDDEIFRLDDHRLMELAIDNSSAARRGLVVEELRQEGFVRVGPRHHRSAADGLTFPFADDRLAAVGMNQVAAYVPPANRPRLSRSQPCGRGYRRRRRGHQA
jgi:anaerobic selenocysteine-containing dehydrogenase